MEKKTDLRILKTHKALCEAFFYLLQKENFEDITVNELCERAMVRRATFYKHFADKYDFFAFFIRYIQDEFIEKREEYYKDDVPYSYCNYMLHQAIDLIKEHQKLVDRVMNSSVVSTLLDIVSDEMYRGVLLNVKEDIKNGHLFSCSPEIIASFYTGGLVRLLKYWIEGKGQITEEQIMGEVEKMLQTFYLGNCIQAEKEKKKELDA